MNTKTQFLLVAMLATACSGSQNTDEQQVQMKDSAVRDIEEERTERARARARVDPESAEPQQPDEELAVQMFELGIGQPVRTESGLVVKMLAEGPAWSFQFDHHGRTDNVQVNGAPLYAEGVAFGHLYVLSELGSSVQLTLRSDTPSEPLSTADALNRARREKAARLGCDGDREETLEPKNGTVVLRVLGSGQPCEIVVGRYTGEVVD